MTTMTKLFPLQPYPSDLSFLQDELAWIDARCRRLGLDAKIAGLPPRGRRRGHDDDDTDATELRRMRERFFKSEVEFRTTIDARRAVTGPLALDRVCALNGLDDFERTVLLLAAAPAFAKSFGDAFAALTREEYGVAECTVELVFSFVEADFTERVDRRPQFASTSRLVSQDLITNPHGHRGADPNALLDCTLSLTSRTFATLVGRLALADELVEFSSLESPLGTLDQVVLPLADRERILAVIDRHDAYLDRRKSWGFDEVIRYGRGILMLFAGPPGTGKTLTAHAVAHRMGKRVLNVDIPTFSSHREADRFLPALFREARLQDAVLFFDECDTLFAARRSGNTLMNVLLTEAERFDGIAILATNEPGALDPALDRRVLVRVEFRAPDRHARAEIWRRHLPAAAPGVTNIDIERLASQYEISGGYIKNAVLTAVAESVQSGAESLTTELLDRAARAQARRGFDCDEERMYPKVRLSHVVVAKRAKQQLGEIVEAARDRQVVLDRWGVGAHLSYGKGVAALFFGPPGTGKTLCAEAIAGELNRPLYALSAASLLSKWVGETELKIEGAFRTAKAQGAVVLFDECDSLFASRAESSAQHDVRAVNSLLVGIERFDGVVILATNLRERLDAALARRMGWAVEFALPAEVERLEIWKKLLPESVPGVADLDLARLAHRYELSGGQIKNIVFRAAFRAAAAGTLDLQTLEAAADEEVGTPRRRSVGFASA